MALKHKHLILLVDDEVSITKALQRLFRKAGYRIKTASGGQEGLEIIQKSEDPVSLIISDQRMPLMTGSQFLEKTREISPDAIRFLLTGYSDMDAIVDAVNKGKIHRYLTKPWNDDDLLLQVRQALEQLELVTENRRLLELTNRQNRELSEFNKNLEKKVNERTGEIKKKNEELEELNLRLEKSFIDTFRLLTSLIGSLNPALGKYMRHVSELVRDVAEKYELEKAALDQIETAGMLHDIGLLGLPEKVWSKDERDMSEAESKMFSQHPVIGSVCLESVERLEKLGEIILSHHECFDGSGFPSGLKGVEIPLGSRIIAVAADYCKIIDIWPKDAKQIFDRTRKYFGPAAKDIMATEPEKMLREAARNIILLGVNKKYDREVVEKFMQKIGGTLPIHAAAKSKEKESRLVDLSELKVGMALGSEVRLKDGRLLLPKGSVLRKMSVDSIVKLGECGLLDTQVSVFV